MNLLRQPTPAGAKSPARRRWDDRASTRTVVLLPAALVVGFLAGTLWHSRQSPPGPASAESPAPIGPSDPPTAVPSPALDASADVRPPAPPAIEPEAAAAVRRLIANPGAVSMEEGKRVLTEAALTDFKAAVDDMEAQLRKAEERFSQAQSSGSETEQQAARKQLQQIRADQAERSKQIAQRLQAQLTALERLKAQ